MSSLRGASDPSSVRCLNFFCHVLLLSRWSLTRRELARVHLLFSTHRSKLQGYSDRVCRSGCIDNGQDFSRNSYRFFSVIHFSQLVYGCVFLKCRQDIVFNRLELIVINYFTIISEEGILPVYYQDMLRYFVVLLLKKKKKEYS